MRAANLRSTEGDGPPGHRAGERPRRGALPRDHGQRGHGAASRWPPHPATGPTRRNFSLPVWTPATTEAFAVYGVLDEGAVAQPVIAPTGVFTQFGGLEIQTSSTALQALTDAVLYLVAYPFECSEQLASRILSVAALRDVLTAFQAEGLPPPAEIEAAVKRDIERLHGMQNDDGGFPIWKRGDESWPYHSIHATHALQRAKKKGYAVPQEMLDSARATCATSSRTTPPGTTPSVRNTLTRTRCTSRKLMGDNDAGRARKLDRRQPGSTSCRPRRSAGCSAC